MSRVSSKTIGKTFVLMTGNPPLIDSPTVADILRSVSAAVVDASVLKGVSGSGNLGMIESSIWRILDSTRLSLCIS